MISDSQSIHLIVRFFHRFLQSVERSRPFELTSYHRLDSPDQLIVLFSTLSSLFVLVHLLCKILKVPLSSNKKVIQILSFGVQFSNSFEIVQVHSKLFEGRQCSTGVDKVRRAAVKF